MAGGKLSIIVDVEVGKDELKDLSESMKNMFEDITLEFDDAKLDALITKFNDFKSNAQEEIMVRMNTATVLSELEQIEERFRSIKTAMESFNVDLGSSTKGGLGKSFMSDVNTMSEGLKKGMSGAGTEIKSVANDIQESMRGLRSVGNADFILSGLQESTAAMKGFSAASASAAAESKSHAAEQVAAYKELEAAIKEYYSALERMDKFQDRVDKGVATRSDLSNLAEAKVQVEQLGAALNELESSLKIGEKRELFSADFDKSAQALKEVGQNAREAKQEVNSAGNEAKQMADAYKELLSIEKEISRLSKQEQSAGEQESAAIREQISLLEEKAASIRAINNLNERGSAIQEEEISKVKEKREADRSIKAGQIGDRATEASLRASQGKRYESIFGMDRMYAYIDVMDLMREGAQLVKRQFNEFRELDSALVDIQKVAEATDTQWKGFTDTLYDNATAVGKTATEYSKSVERWAAAGFDLDEAAELGTLSTMGAFVGNIDEEAMVKYMSVPLNAFKKSVDATDVLNVMNEVANNTAAEMDHLGQAYSRAAATAAQSGTSFEELTAVLATAQEGTRLGGETIGTTWRNMDKNISSIAARGSAGNIEKFDMFAQWGVDLVDANGELRSTFDVLKDLEGVWSNLDSIQKSTAAQAIGGTRGMPIIQSVMENWERVEEILGMAQGEMGMGEAGSAFREFEIQSDSMEFKIAKLHNTWQSFMNSLMGGDASGVFKGALDEMIGFVETLQSISENESAVSVISGLAKGLASMIAIDFASSGIQKLFGDRGLFGGLGNMVKGFKDATKGASSFGGVIKGMLTSGGWAAAPGKIMLVVAAYQALSSAIDALTGKTIGQHLKSWVDPMSNLRDSTERYTQAVQNMNEVFERGDAIRGQINDYRELTSAFEESHRARQQAYAQSGEVASLEIPEDEFNQLKERHNQMVDELDLSTGFRIEFNNYDHLMSQIQRLKDELAEIEAQTMKDDVVAANEAYTERRKTLSEIEKNSAQIRDREKEIQSLYEERESLDTEDPYHYDRLNTLNGEIEAYEASLDRLKQVRRDILTDEDMIENERAVQKATEKMADYIDGIFKGDNAADAFMSLFGGDTLEAQQTGMFSFLMGINNQIEELQSRKGELESLQDTFSDFSTLEAGTKPAANAFNDLNNQIDELGTTLTDSQPFKDFMTNIKTLGEEGYDSIGELFEAATNGSVEAQEAIQQLVNEVIPSSIDSQITQLEQAKSDLLTLATQAGFNVDEVNKLEAAFEEGASMGEMVQTMMELNAGAATAALGLSNEAYALANDRIEQFGGTAAEVFGNVADAVYNLEPVKLAELIDDEGIPDFERVLSDLSQITNQDFLVELGVTTQDGMIQDLNAFYDFMDNIKAMDAEDLGKLEVSTELVLESGKVNEQGVLDAINAGELTVEVTADGEMFLKDLEGNTVEVDIEGKVSGTDGDALTEQIKAQAGDGTVEIEVNAALVPGTDTVGTGGYDDWLRGLESSGLLEGHDVEVPVSMQADLEPIDAQALAQELAAGADQEMVIDMMAQANVEVEMTEDGSIDYNALTDELESMLGSGDAHQIETAINVMTYLGLLKDTSIEEVEGQLEEIEGLEADVPVDITADPDTEGVSSAVTESMQGIALGNIEPIDVSAIVNIALEENIIQDNLSGIADILSEDYDVEIGIDVEDGGLAQVTSALRELPPEQQIMVLAKALGLDSIDGLSETLEGIPPEKVVNAILEATGTETLQEGLEALENFDGQSATAEALTMYSQEGEEPEPPTDASATHTIENTESGEKPEPPEDEEATHTTFIEFSVTNPQALMDLDGEDISFTVIANITDNASAGIQSINSAITALPETKSVAITANAAGATFTIAAVGVALAALGALTVTPTIDGDKTGFDDAAAEVEGWVPPSFMVVIDADTGPFRDAVSGLSGLVPRSLSTTITASVVRSSASASIGIGSDIGRSFSNSIGSSLGLFGTSFNQQINRSQSETEEKKVNEDIWRYWAKELYDGDELANSMDELTAAINRAGDDWAKIISLSRQQISLAQEQMRFEREMSDIEQQQLDSVLSELRGYGFTTEGNKITNLDHAKNLSGDDASEAESALNTWKGLYKSIAGLGVRLSGLEGTIHGAEEAIKDARMNMELEALEKRLAKTELLLTAISNNLEILNDKDSFVGSEDYELKIKVSEENIDSSISNIQTLIDEFNQLSVMTFEFEENAEVLQSSLEKLADEIIDNADNILRFREQIIAVRLDALTDDFDRFSDAVDRNTDSLSRNVDILKEGLLSAYGTAELGNTYTVDYQRKSALEREYEERLRLAASLDAALEGYTRKNVERSLGGMNAQLQIARDGYNELFRIQQGFTGSGMGDINSYLGNSQVSVSGSQFSRTQAKLLQHLTSYQAAYNKQIVEYNNALRGAITTRDREIVQHDMIIAQLALQEEYQNKAIVQYKEAIRLAEAELQNRAITTEQRRDLLDFIDEYREKMTDAYDVIRDAVKARFEYEFDMMDKATDKAELYYNNIAHLLDVGQMINLSPDALKPFFDAMYKASSYQYALAQEQLAQLNAQQKQFTSGSYEWNLLAEQIDNVKEAMKDITIQSLESNQAILENTMNALEKMFQVGLLGGKTLDEWKDYNEEWVDGLEKEITLESLRRKAIDAESEIIRERLNMLDRQDQVSKSDLDYIDKQLKVLELEGKLRNIERERDVQVLGRRADGTWGFDYVADQSEYDKTKEELDESRIDLEQFITEQRTNYVERLGDILGRAREGGYTDPADLRADLDLLNSIYSMVLSDIPGFTGMSFDEILAAYQEYLANNDIITDGIVDSGIGEIDDSIKGVGLTPVQQELVGVTTQLGEIIGSELRKALGATDSSGFKGPQIYQIGELVLPNVTDGDGLVNIFNDLPKAAEQAVYDKSN